MKATVEARARPTPRSPERAEGAEAADKPKVSLLQRLAIPQAYWEWIATSWREASPHLYGRMDFAYDGSGLAKDAIG